MPKTIELDFRLGGDATDKIKEMESALKQLERQRKEIEAYRSAGHVGLTEQRTRHALDDARASYESERSGAYRAHTNTSSGSGMFRKGGQIAQSAMSGGAGAAISKMGAAGAAVAAAMEMTEKGMEKVGRAAEILNNSFMTAGQKQRALIEEYVPLAGAFKKMTDGVSGVTDRLNRMVFESEQRQIKAGITSEYAIRSRALNQEMSQAQLRGGAVGSVPYAARQTFDRFTASGAIGYGENELRQPLQDAMVTAQRNSLAARGYETEARGGLSASNAALDRAQKEYDAARARRNRVRGNDGKIDWKTPGSALATALDIGGEQGEAMKRADLDMNERGQALDIARRQNEEAVTRAKQAGLSAAEAESRVRKQGIEIAKGELEILKQKESRMAGTARGLGSMHAGDRLSSKMMAHQVLNHLERGGNLGDLPPEMVNAASRYAGVAIGAQQEKEGEAAAREFRKERGASANRWLGEDFANGNGLSDVRNRMPKVQADINMKIDLDEQALAKRLFELLKPFGDNLIKQVHAEIATAFGKSEQNAAKMHPR